MIYAGNFEGSYAVADVMQQVAATNITMMHKHMHSDYVNLQKALTSCSARELFFV